MRLLPWLPEESEGLLVYAGMLLVWAEMLYVSTRGRGGAATTLAGLGMGSFSIYLLGLWAGALGIGPATQAGHLPVGPLFNIFQLYVLIALVAAAGILGWLWHSQPSGTPLHERFGGLLACGVLFLLGGGYLGVATADLHGSA